MPDDERNEAITTDASGRDAVRVPLDASHDLVVARRERGATLSVRASSGQRELEIEIAFTERGPVLRAWAASIELETEGAIEARCSDFTVDASRSIALRAGGDVMHRAGGALSVDAAEIAVAARERDLTLKANDDVRLKGEHVLLNCERQAPLPEWVPRGLDAIEETPATLAPGDSSGDASLLADLGPRR